MFMNLQSLLLERARPGSVPTMEAISYQTGLFNELTKAVEKLRAEKTYDTKAINDSDIPNIINIFTDMLVSIDINPDYDNAAFITWPSIDKNHPFINEFLRKHIVSDTGLTLIRALDGEIRGSIDIKTGRVSGIFTKVQGDITLGAGLLRNKQYTSGEIAAIILHELGHLWTYFVYLGTMVTSSHVIAAVSKAVYDIDNKEERLVVIKEAERVLGVDVKEKERLAALPKQIRSLATDMVFISAKAEKSQSETGYNIYELRSVEQLADRFATQHGAGVELASGLQKLFQNYAHSSTISTTQHTLIEVCKVIIFTAGLMLNPVGTVVYLLMSNPTEKQYDDPEARIRLIKQMLIDELKDQRIKPTRRAQLQKDIDVVSRIEGELNDKRSALELFWTKIMPSGRRAMSQQESQKLIEDLLNNELFVKAANFAN